MCLVFNFIINCWQ